MSKGGYKIFDQGGMYFVNFAVVNWVDVFTRKEYRNIVIEKFATLSRGTGSYHLCLVCHE